MRVDAYTHFFPKKFFDKLNEVAGDYKDMGKRIRSLPALFDIDVRKKIVDNHKDYQQILSYPQPPIERFAKNPADCVVIMAGWAVRLPSAFRTCSIARSTSPPRNRTSLSVESASLRIWSGASAQIATLSSSTSRAFSRSLNMRIRAYRCETQARSLALAFRETTTASLEAICARWKLPAEPSANPSQPSASIRDFALSAPR